MKEPFIKVLDPLLLYASARGARLQFYHKEVGFKGKWIDTDSRPSSAAIQEWRVHPEDEHLKYGVVSTSVRLAAIDPPEFLDHAYQEEKTVRLFDIFAKHSEVIAYNLMPVKRRSTFLLFLAEALAYEGL